MLAELALPASGLALTLASYALIASAGAGVVAPFGTLATNGAAMVLPLAAVLALSVRPVQVMLRSRLSPLAAGGGTALLAALFLAALAGRAQPDPQSFLAVFLRTLAAGSLPVVAFALVRRHLGAAHEEPSVMPLDVGAGVVVLVLAGQRGLRLDLHLGSRPSGLHAMDAGFFVWMLVLAVYVVLVRRLELGFDLRAGRRDLAVAAGVFSGLLAVLLPLAVALGYVRSLPPLDPPVEVLYATAYYLFRIALGEELFFRAILQSALVAWAGRMFGSIRGPAFGIALAALIFGLCHLRFGPGFAVLATIAGAGYGWAYVLTGRLTAPVLVHGLVDVTNSLLH